MYSARLRKNALWPAVLPQLTSCTRWKFKEYPCGDFDLAVPLVDGGGKLYINLLLATEFNKHFAKEESTILQGVVWPDHKIVMLVDQTGNTNSDKLIGVAALIKMQTRQLEQASTAPAVLVPSLEQVVQYLGYYHEDLKSPLVTSPSPHSRSRSIVAAATTKAPHQCLSKQQVEAVSHSCANVRALEEALRTTMGRAELTRVLDEATVRSMIDFWRDEWIA